jgi:hypothetical protein
MTKIRYLVGHQFAVLVATVVDMVAVESAAALPMTTMPMPVAAPAVPVVVVAAVTCNPTKESFQ